MAIKRYLETDVLTAARARISLIFDHFDRIYMEHGQMHGWDRAIGAVRKALGLRR